ncbi:MAG: shikimate dehydrogenase [Chloroflexota bacterium]|nr:MAG: shikimate dehydrogenase [Chloroflexota bacterium]
MATYRLGVIGWPVEHSLSPAMHNAAFQALGMDNWQYELLPVPPDIVRLALREFRNHGYVGVNVTVPLKELVMPHVRPDERAQAIGAVNTITLRDLSATNTDVPGFMDDLKANGVDVAGKRVIVLGAGGAARAAVYGLAQAGAVIAVVNRTPERAEQMVEALKVDAMPMTLEAAIRVRPDLIVNCTSVGMWPNTNASPWPADVPFPEGVTVYDMVYRPERTRFMAQAEAAGGRAIGGLGMLARQGAAAFEIWTGKQAPVDVMLNAARTVLRARESAEKT